ncbi:hypothetical protein DVH07_08085 [Hafnia paralvei]|nr:hypothetical protein DU449_07505 [Hafnia paralvei]RDA70434.1 hypothetical protein DVH08_07690 [Hafnia paralvei]RDA79541.1 hypothetical protein DVH07_08085 [Hafnia paralvei]TGU83121.1 hypothetical protein DVH11_005395 [Hafnia paralvei]
MHKACVIFDTLGVRKITPPIFLRSVKTGMMRRGNPRSGLGRGAKLGCRVAAIGPPDSDAFTRLV